MALPQARRDDVQAPVEGLERCGLIGCRWLCGGLRRASLSCCPNFLSGNTGESESMAQPHESRVYSDLAHFYDRVFGRAFVDSEHEVIESLGLRPGHQVLELGVGTG